MEFRPRRIRPLTEVLLDLPLRPPRRDRMSVFLVPQAPSRLARWSSTRGAGKRLFAAAEPRVSPWDLAVILMHARRIALFGAGDRRGAP